MNEKRALDLEPQIMEACPERDHSCFARVVICTNETLFNGRAFADIFIVANLEEGEEKAVEAISTGKVIAAAFHADAIALN